jgi:acyl-CoA synthetase (AMP-forming)/AMP-acid ligase II
MTQRCLQLGDTFEVVADSVPDREALITEDIIYTYGELDERVTRLANHLLAAGIGRGDHVGIHATNCPEWVESFFACCKIGAVPINVNYRYVEAELRYLYDNADCVAVIVEPEFLGAVEAVTDALPGLRHRLVIGDEYEAALAAASPERNFPGRTPDDTYIVYTGGTTGMPKGVMWRHEDIILGAMNALRMGAPIERVEQLGDEAANSPFPMRLAALGPMMHGGGQWVMGNAYLAGGTLVLYTGKKFDAHAIWRLVERAKANSVSTIGDAMARPLAEALLEPGASYDTSSVVSIGNGGAPLSAKVREQLRAALPNAIILDSYGASETGAAAAKMDDGKGYSAPRFQAGPDVTVLADDGRHCAVGEVGKLARSGYIPLGYYKDEAKTAATFPVVEGKRWVVPGDFAQLEEDGTITVLGRGSVSINSGGEKIFPEEVEAALKHHPDVFDAVVVGTPSERWGEQVTALVQLREGAAVDVDSLIATCRTLVADYKIPKVVEIVPQVVRTPVGKADYQWAKSEALTRLGLS